MRGNVSLYFLKLYLSSFKAENGVKFRSDDCRFLKICVQKSALRKSF